MLTKQDHRSEATNRSGAMPVSGRIVAIRLVLALLCLAASLMLAQATAFAQDGPQAIVEDPPTDPSGRPIDVEDGPDEEVLLDCRDVATRRGAQALYELYPPSDRFKLDRDNDGRACETPEDSNTAEDGTVLGAATGGDLRDCVDFASQADAQSYLRAQPSDPYKLDVENIGIACQITPTEYEDPARDVTPVSEAISNADLDCTDFEYQEEAQVAYFLDETDPDNLDASMNNDGSEVCLDLPELPSNAFYASGFPTGDTESTKAGPEPPTLLAQVTYSEGAVNRLTLILDVCGAILVASGLAALLAVWRRRSSGSA